MHPDEERIDQVEVRRRSNSRDEYIFSIPPIRPTGIRNTAKERHRTFSPSELYPNERLAPNADKTGAEFPEDRDWTPSRGLKGRRLSPIVPPWAESVPINSNHTSASNGPATVATAIASSAKSGDSLSLTTTATAHACDDAHMADYGFTSAIALPVTPRSAPS